jgi:hypothetical protein
LGRNLPRLKREYSMHCQVGKKWDFRTVGKKLPNEECGEAQTYVD